MAGVLARLVRPTVRGAFALTVHAVVKPARAAGLAHLALALAAGDLRAGSNNDLPVPPGTHPGGIPVAVVGRGIDYTANTLHPRLARDGEGEITGYDFAGDDRLPFSTAGDTEAARLLLREGQAAALVVVRTNFAQAKVFGPSLRFVLRSPAQIVMLMHPFDGEDFVALVGEAAKNSPRHLFIVEAGDEGLDLDGITPAASQGIGNVLVVAAAMPDGRLHEMANSGKTSVDVAVLVEDIDKENAIGERPLASALAVARIAALAARLKATAPDLSGSQLKERILALANPMPTGANRQTRSGWIGDPKRPFWLE